MPTSIQPARNAATATAVKVPAITAMFWVIKLLTTGMGEAASDFIGGQPLVLAGVLGILAFAGLVGALRLQFRSPVYVPWIYWFAVAMVAVFGTVAADGVHVGLGIPYAVSSTFWAVVVANAFWLWRRSEGTLSIHSINTRRRETFYWVTVLATFALGTALGDLTATEMNLGFLASAVLFAAVMIVPALGWARFGMNSVLAFWFAYVVTRPLGASIADWLAKPHSFGAGLGFGDGLVALVSVLIIAALVGYVTVTGHDRQRD